MNNEICVGYLTNIRDMFAVGSERCEDEALKYYQNFISALNYAIKLINAPTVEPRIEYGTDGQPYKLFISNGKEFERPQGEWITGGKDVTGQYFYDEFICNQCFVVVTDKSNFCPNCGADMQKKEN